MIRSAIVGGAALLLAAWLVGIVAAQTNSSEAHIPPKSVYAELAKVPAKAAGRHNPLEADPEAVAAGTKLFEQHCAECHGANAEGGKKALVCAPTKCSRRRRAPCSGC